MLLSNSLEISNDFLNTLNLPEHLIPLGGCVFGCYLNKEMNLLIYRIFLILMIPKDTNFSKSYKKLLKIFIVKLNTF